MDEWVHLYESASVPRLPQQETRKWASFSANAETQCAQGWMQYLQSFNKPQCPHVLFIWLTCLPPQQAAATRPLHAPVIIWAWHSVQCRDENYQTIVNWVLISRDSLCRDYTFSVVLFQNTASWLAVPFHHPLRNHTVQGQQCDIVIPLASSFSAPVKFHTPTCFRPGFEVSGLLVV